MKAVTDDQYRKIIFYLGFAMALAPEKKDKDFILQLVKELERQNNDGTL